MRKFCGLFLSVALCLFLAVGCSTMSQFQKNVARGAATGAAIGAGTGAALGSLTHSKNDVGIGAIAGGAAGLIFGGFYGALMPVEKEQAPAVVIQQPTSGNPGVDSAYYQGYSERKAAEQRTMEVEAYQKGRGETSSTQAWWR